MKPVPSQFVTLCGRIFRGADAGYFPHASYRGRTLYLCTQVCLDAFLADPERFFRAHRRSAKHKGPIGNGESQNVA